MQPKGKSIIDLNLERKIDGILHHPSASTISRPFDQNLTLSNLSSVNERRSVGNSCFPGSIEAGGTKMSERYLYTYFGSKLLFQRP